MSEYTLTGPAPGHPIFDALRVDAESLRWGRSCVDAEALRRELAAGVDPDVTEYDWSRTLLHKAVLLDRLSMPPPDDERIRERLECIAVLLEAGASVDKLVSRSCGGTALYYAVGDRCAPPEYHAVIAALVEAGADVNYDTGRHSVLANAATGGRAATVNTLISAGAVDLDRALELAIIHNAKAGKLRICTLLLRAGAALPAVCARLISRGFTADHQRPACAYIESIRAAGGFKAYETAHRQRLVAIYAPKFPHLPTDMLGRVLEYSYNVGGY